MGCAATALVIVAILGIVAAFGSAPPSKDSLGCRKADDAQKAIPAEPNEFWSPETPGQMLVVLGAALLLVGVTGTIGFFLLYLSMFVTDGNGLFMICFFILPLPLYGFVLGVALGLRSIYYLIEYAIGLI